MTVAHETALEQAPQSTARVRYASRQRPQTGVPLGLRPSYACGVSEEGKSPGAAPPVLYV